MCFLRICYSLSWRSDVNSYIKGCWILLKRVLQTVLNWVVARVLTFLWWFLMGAYCWVSLQQAIEPLGMVQCHLTQFPLLCISWAQPTLLESKFLWQWSTDKNSRWSCLHFVYDRPFYLVEELGAIVSSLLYSELCWSALQLPLGERDPLRI